MMTPVRILGILLVMAISYGCSDDTGSDEDSGGAVDSNAAAETSRDDSGGAADVGQITDLDPDPCRRLAVKVCKEGCACGATYNGGKCCFLTKLQNKTCYNANTCQLTFLNDVCGDTTKQASMFLGCEAALSTATCSEYSGKKVLGLPTACDTLLDCNSGPCKS